MPPPEEEEEDAVLLKILPLVPPDDEDRIVFAALVTCSLVGTVLAPVITFHDRFVTSVCQKWRFWCVSPKNANTKI